MSSCAADPQKPKRKVINYFKTVYTAGYDIGPRVETPLQTSSRLSKTLHEVLHDQNAIPYLLQYMDCQGVGHFVKFWLDANSFQASSWTRIQSQSLKLLSKSSVSKARATQVHGQGQEDQGQGQNGQRQVQDGKATDCDVEPSGKVVSHSAKDLGVSDADTAAPGIPLNATCTEGDTNRNQSLTSFEDSANPAASTELGTETPKCNQTSQSARHNNVAHQVDLQQNACGEASVIGDTHASTAGADAVVAGNSPAHSARGDEAAGHSTVASIATSTVTTNTGVDAVPSTQHSNSGYQAPSIASLGSCTDSVVRSSLLKSQLLGVSEEEQLQERLRRSKYFTAA